MERSRLRRGARAAVSTLTGVLAILLLLGAAVIVPYKVHLSRLASVDDEVVDALRPSFRIVADEQETNPTDAWWIRYLAVYLPDGSRAPSESERRIGLETAGWRIDPDGDAAHPGFGHTAYWTTVDELRSEVPAIAEEFDDAIDGGPPPAVLVLE